MGRSVTNLSPGGHFKQLLVILNFEDRNNCSSSTLSVKTLHIDFNDSHIESFKWNMQFLSIF